MKSDRYQSNRRWKAIAPKSDRNQTYYAPFYIFRVPILDRPEERSQLVFLSKFT
ncbi:hypothetical protein [Merismopedia glauca]|uniref:hypothetical protein n=1 Tax=Merismopedia glauca TaxID=292586 RepID=UPI0015E6767D|nr:hypothetical protein [Merismopedia glauca]